MSQAAKVQEPSMEEILASIRRIIADDEGGKPAAAPAAGGSVVAMTPPAAATPAAPSAEPAAISQTDIDAMLAGFEEEAEAGATEADGVPPDAATREAAEAQDVLELTEAMQAEEEPPPQFQTIDAVSDVVFTDPPPQYADLPPQYEEPAAPRAPFTDMHAERPLLSDHATSAAASAFGALAHTVFTKNARTMEDLVSEMLRPMLKAWLDDNLPTIVERLVRAEIERVSRGRS